MDPMVSDGQPRGSIERLDEPLMKAGFQPGCCSMGAVETRKYQWKCFKKTPGN